MRRPRPDLVAVAVVVAVGALLGAACSDDADVAATSSTTTEATTSTTLSPRDQGIRFAECVRANGVSDFPDPDASGEFNYGVSVTPEVWVAAVEACEDLQPPGSLSADRTPEEQSAALRFAQCMRDNGVADFPDPIEGEPLVDTYRIPSSNTDEGMAILDAAMATCGELAEDASGDG